MRDLRAAFLEALQTEEVTCFKFVDETSTNLTYCRHYARAEGGQWAHQTTPRHGGPNVTLVAALTPAGLHAAMTVSGVVNGDVFAAYLDQVLGPTLVPGDVVVLDNLPAHKVAGLAELVEVRGARLLYLPPYSPNSNPIERAFSKLKIWLRTAHARTREALESVMQRAAQHLAGSTNPIGATVLNTTTREILRCALHDRPLFLFRNKSIDRASIWHALFLLLIERRVILRCYHSRLICRPA